MRNVDTTVWNSHLRALVLDVTGVDESVTHLTKRRIGLHVVNTQYSSRFATIVCAVFAPSAYQLIQLVVEKREHPGNRPIQLADLHRIALVAILLLKNVSQSYVGDFLAVEDKSLPVCFVAQDGFEVGLCDIAHIDAWEG